MNSPTPYIMQITFRMDQLQDQTQLSIRMEKNRQAKNEVEEALAAEVSLLEKIACETLINQEAIEALVEGPQPEEVN